MTDRPRILVPDVMDDPWQMPKKKKKERRERTGPTLGIAKHGDAHDEKSHGNRSGGTATKDRPSDFRDKDKLVQAILPNAKVAFERLNLTRYRSPEALANMVADIHLRVFDPKAEFSTDEIDDLAVYAEIAGYRPPVLDRLMDSMEMMEAQFNEFGADWLSGVKKKLRTLGIMKHYGPVHPGTSSSQKPHGNWSRSVPIQDYVDEDGTIQTWDRDSLKKPRRFEPYTQPSLLDAEGEVKPSLGIYDSGDKPYVSPIKHPLKRPDMGPRLEGIMKRGSARRKRFMKHMAGVEERRAKLVEEYGQLLKDQAELPGLYTFNSYVSALQANIARAEAARWGLEDANPVINYLSNSQYGEGVLERLQSFRDEMRRGSVDGTQTLKLTKAQLSNISQYLPGQGYQDIEDIADEFEIKNGNLVFKTQNAMDVWRRRFSWAKDDAYYDNAPSTARMYDRMQMEVMKMPPILEGGAQADNNAMVYVQDIQLRTPYGTSVDDVRVNLGKPRWDIDKYRQVNAKEIVDRASVNLMVVEDEYVKVQAQHAEFRKKLDANTNRRLQMWREETRDFLESEGIEFGAELQVTSKRGGGIDLVEAASYYPKAWVEAQNQLNSDVSFVTKKGARAHYSSWQNQIQRDGTFGTDIHELGHIMEKLPNIRLAMEDYATWRKRGYREERIQDLLKRHGYGAHETTTLDEFIHPYSGRNYGSGSYEILTMGMQTLYTAREIGDNGEIYSGTVMETIKGEKRKYQGVDAEHLDFIFGLMDIDPLDKSGLNDLADSV